MMLGKDLGAIFQIKKNYSLLSRTQVNGSRDYVQTVERNCFGPFEARSYTHDALVYLLKGEEPPECIPCNSILSVKHLLIECTDLEPYRDKYFHLDISKTFFDITIRLS